MTDTPTRLTAEQEAIEQAAAELLLRIAFLVPKGTDLDETVGPELMAYREAVIAPERARAEAAERRLTKIRELVEGPLENDAIVLAIAELLTWVAEPQP